MDEDSVFGVDKLNQVSDYVKWEEKEGDDGADGAGYGLKFFLLVVR